MDVLEIVEVIYTVNGGKKQRVEAKWQNNREIGPVGRPFPFGSEVWEAKFIIKDVKQKTDKIEFQVYLDRATRADATSEMMHLTLQ
jgi:hypothetical protein